MWSVSQQWAAMALLWVSPRRIANLCSFRHNFRFLFVLYICLHSVHDVVALVYQESSDWPDSFRSFFTLSLQCFQGLLVVVNGVAIQMNSLWNSVVSHNCQINIDMRDLHCHWRTALLHGYFHALSVRYHCNSAIMLWFLPISRSCATRKQSRKCFIVQQQAISRR